MSKILLVAIGLAAASVGAQTMSPEPPQAVLDRNFERSTSVNPLNVITGPAIAGTDYINPARRAKLTREREAKAAKAAAAKAAAANPPA